jgi:hypothetical protein
MCLGSIPVSVHTLTEQTLDAAPFEKSVVAVVGKKTKGI